LWQGSFVASERWKPPEMAAAMGIVQERYDPEQALFVPAVAGG